MIAMPAGPIMRRRNALPIVKERNAGRSCFLRRSPYCRNKRKGFPSDPTADFPEKGSGTDENRFLNHQFGAEFSERDGAEENGQQHGGGEDKNVAETEKRCGARNIKGSGKNSKSQTEVGKNREDMHA